MQTQVKRGHLMPKIVLASYLLLVAEPETFVLAGWGGFHDLLLFLINFITRNIN
jgi:hypothetical protein